MEQVDFAGPYYYASIVCVAKDGSPQASAKGISELTGTATAQIETIWYDTCLPQIKGAEIQTAAETAPAMLMALETGAVEFICTDIPTAKGAVAAYDDMVILDFTDTEDNFQVDEGDINIGISLKKGNTELKDAINKVVSALNKDNFDNLMDYAVSIQPFESVIFTIIHNRPRRYPGGGAGLPSSGQREKGVLLCGTIRPARLRYGAFVEPVQWFLFERHQEHPDLGGGGYLDRVPDRLCLWCVEHHSLYQK